MLLIKQVYRSKAVSLETTLAETQGLDENRAPQLKVVKDGTSQVYRIGSEIRVFLVSDDLMYSSCSVGTEAKVPGDVGRGEQQSWRFSRGRSP